MFPSHDHVDERIEPAKDLIVSLRRGDVDDNLNERQSADHELTPVSNDKINHGANISNYE